MWPNVQSIGCPIDLSLIVFFDAAVSFPLINTYLFHLPIRLFALYLDPSWNLAIYTSATTYRS